jgi:hypothetical protein
VFSTDIANRAGWLKELWRCHSHCRSEAEGTWIHSSRLEMADCVSASVVRALGDGQAILYEKLCAVALLRSLLLSYTRWLARLTCLKERFTFLSFVVVAHR